MDDPRVQGEMVAVRASVRSWADDQAVLERVGGDEVESLLTLAETLEPLPAARAIAEVLDAAIGGEFAAQFADLGDRTIEEGEPLPRSSARLLDLIGRDNITSPTDVHGALEATSPGAEGSVPMTREPDRLPHLVLVPPLEGTARIRADSVSKPLRMSAGAAYAITRNDPDSESIYSFRSNRNARPSHRPSRRKPRGVTSTRPVEAKVSG